MDYLLGNGCASGVIHPTKLVPWYDGLTQRTSNRFFVVCQGGKKLLRLNCGFWKRLKICRLSGSAQLSNLIITFTLRLCSLASSLSLAVSGVHIVVAYHER